MLSREEHARCVHDNPYPGEMSPRLLDAVFLPEVPGPGLADRSGKCVRKAAGMLARTGGLRAGRISPWRQPGRHGAGQAALALLGAEGMSTVRVATAAADIDNLRFYQRQGFRMRSIERDAFTGAAGYPPGSQVAGIALRDRVWLDLKLGSASSGTDSP
jgi:hypothetical protein